MHLDAGILKILFNIIIRVIIIVVIIFVRKHAGFPRIVSTIGSAGKCQSKHVGMSEEIENLFYIPRVSNNKFLDLSKVDVFILKHVVQISVKCVFLTDSD